MSEVPQRPERPEHPDRPDAPRDAATEGAAAEGAATEGAAAGDAGTENAWSGASRAVPAGGSGAHPSVPPRGRRWSWFKAGPLWPATVVALLLALAAGIFAGSYTYAMASPAPNHLPVGVTGDPGDIRRSGYVRALDEGLDTRLRVHRYRNVEQARQALDEQKIFATVHIGDGGRAARVELSGASGVSVADVLAKAAPKAGESARTEVTVKDVNPLQEGDPRGLAIFYLTLAAVIVGFVGAIQLTVHGHDLGPLARIAFTAGYAMLGALAIVAAVDWWIDAVDMPDGTSWAILALTMFTSGMVSTMFTALFGRWAMLPTWGLLVIVGNPSSGGAVSWPLLPTPLQVIGRWLPPGASVSAQHTAVYFAGYQHLMPFLVLGGWALLSTVVFWLWRSSHPGAERTELPEGAGI